MPQRKIDRLTLISGVDIVIPELKTSLHQPTIKEIAYVGEKDFYEAAEILTVDKEKFVPRLENIPEEDKNVLLQMSNFELFLKLTNMKAETTIKIYSLLALLFPQHSIQIEDRFIFLVKQNEKTAITTIVDENNFDILQKVVITTLCLDIGKGEEEFNPAGVKAREIAEKIKRGREKAAKLKGENGKQSSSILSKYISSLGIGTNTLNIKDILGLTLYQFFNQLERYDLFTKYNISIQARMAGAKDVEDIDWLQDTEK